MTGAVRRVWRLSCALLMAGIASPLHAATSYVYAKEALLTPGLPPAKDVLISILDHRILKVEVGAARPSPAEIGGSTLIDLSCCFIMPGFIDVQTHLASQPGMPPSRTRLLSWSDAQSTLVAATNALRTLQAGFTTVRDMGNSGRSVFAVADAVRAGTIQGPRIQVAGELIRPTGSIGSRPWTRNDLSALTEVSAICDGPADCTRAVRAQVALGASTIKVDTKQDLKAGSPASFSHEELTAIAATAHALGRKATASAFSAASINAPLKAGFDAIAHGAFADEETVRLLRRTGAYYVPTLAAAQVVFERATDPKSPVSDEWRVENLAIHRGMLASFRRVLAAEGKIAFGTDAGWRAHGENAKQMVEMVQLGMTPAAVLKAATAGAADAMGLASDVGSLQAGQYADIVATRSSPLTDIREVTRPVLVMKGGDVIRDDRTTRVVKDNIKNGSEVVILHVGRLYTEPGKPVRSQQSIIIRGKLIESVSAGYVTPASIGELDAKVIDLTDQFVMPGMMDAHVHLTTGAKADALGDAATTSNADLALVAATNAESILRAGFTTVMDMGTGLREHELAIYAVRDAVAARLTQGPEIRSSGAPLSITGFSRTSRHRDGAEVLIGPEGVCDGADSCRSMVRKQIKNGADFINVYTTGSLLADNSPAQTFNDDELGAIRSEAWKFGRVVVADGGNNEHSAAGTNAAIRAGFNIIDTVTYPDTHTFALLKKTRGYFAPHVYAMVAAVVDTPETLTNGTMGWLPFPILQKLLQIRQDKSSALTGYQAGASLILASDSGVFRHGDNAQELIEYSKLGIPPPAALAAATLNLARAHGIDRRTGSIDIGKEADIIALGGNPMTDIHAVLNVRFVMSDGLIYVSR